jgi:cytochrome c553
MKRILFIALILMGAAGFAAAQITTPTTDVLGAHLNYGRGCAACHAPHSGAYGNGAAKSADTGSGVEALWGEDVGSLYNKTIITGQSEHGSYSETLPASLTAGTPDVSGVLMCLSCHDGNYAQGAMMKNSVYEALPATYGKGTIPTLLGNDGSGASNYLNDHPVGTNAVMTCGGSYDWDCNISASGKVLMNGAKSSLFIQNYGFFVSPAVVSNQPVVMCTTCHNQHLMNVVNVTTGVTFTGSGATGTVSGKSGLPSGSYATMFFLRGPYNPADANTATNQTAQFCRQCHGGESNEMNGSTAGTVF